MKTIFLSTVMLAMSVANAAPMASDTTKEINAQTTITRGQIDNILDKMNRQNNQSAFKASDYYAQTGAFKENIERVLRNFEDKFEKVILPKAAFWMDQYNSIYSSNEFSSEQKKVLLRERKSHISNQFQAITKEYREALKSVYGLMPRSDFKSPTFEYFPETLEYRGGTIIKQKIKVKIKLNEDVAINDEITFEDGKIPNRTITFSDGRKETVDASRSGVDSYSYGIDIMEYNPMLSKKYFDVKVNFSKIRWLDDLVMPQREEFIFEKFYYPVMKGTCESSICVGLRAGDLLTLMTLIKSQIDRNISLKLLDGEYLFINGLNFDTTNLSKNLSRVEYPEELPFDL